MDIFPSLHCLQPVDVSEKTAPLACRLTAVSHRNDTDGGSIFHGERNGELTVSGLFGDFHEGYWRQYTKIGRLFIGAQITGSARLRVFWRDAQRKHEALILDTLLEGAGGRVVAAVPGGQGGETRLFFSLTIVSERATLARIGWLTDAAPRRAVTLAAVICTFNREPELAETLRQITSPGSGIGAVIVVNQGRRGLAGRLPAPPGTAAETPVTVIEQDNFGGAGGFCRGILECLARPGHSHILLMDDDIDLDRSVTGRLARVLAYTDAEHCIGGAMLDLLDRSMLFSAGDVLHENRPEIRNLAVPGEDDMATPAGCDYVARLHHPDFNGWWFFAFPVRAVEKIGLPLPLFIRGDDIEYGYRLKRAGFSTVPWPGIAVWHMPFYKKRLAWHYFYDRRNSLFLCEMHRRFSRRRLAGVIVVGFLNHFLRYDYDRAAFIVGGLAAFNRGVAGLTGWTGEDHAALLGSAETTPVAMPVPAAIVRRRQWRSAVAVSALRLVMDLTLPSLPGGRAVVVEAQDWRPTIRRRPRKVWVVYGHDQPAAEYRHRIGRAWRCFSGLTAEMLKFLLWRKFDPQSLAELTTAEFWESYLGIRR